MHYMIQLWHFARSGKKKNLRIDRVELKFSNAV